MEIKPILFNTDMVRAILGGRKRQTRLIMKPQAWCEVPWDCAKCDQWTLDCKTHQGCPVHCVTVPPPPYFLHDTMWVRETWDCLPVLPDGHFATHKRYYYKADGDIRPDVWRGNWGSPLSMPKSAARIFLRVKNGWVKRLNDMSEEDAISEGFADSPSGTDSPLERYSAYWDKHIKRADLREFGWHANPWVWVIEFERCEKPEGWCSE